MVAGSAEEEAGAAAGADSAVVAEVAAGAASAAGSATRARPRRSSVGATHTPTHSPSGYWLLFWYSRFSDLLVGFLSVLACAEVSTFLHACEGEAVTKLTNEKVPYFNAPIYLQNKTQIGKVEEIFGPINESVSTSSPP